MKWVGRVDLPEKKRPCNHSELESVVMTYTSVRLTYRTKHCREYVEEQPHVVVSVVSR